MAPNGDRVVGHETTALFGFKNATPGGQNAGGSTSSAGLQYHDLNLRLDEDHVPPHLGRNGNPQDSIETTLANVIPDGNNSGGGLILYRISFRGV